MTIATPQRYSALRPPDTYDIGKEFQERQNIQRAISDALDFDSSGVFNVKAKPFKAKGDGIADDTKAFTDAWSAVQANGGGTVYAPAGNYVVNFPLLLPKMSLVGDGAGRTTFIAGSTACSLHGIDASNILLRDFTFQGASNSGVAATAEAVLIRAVAQDVLNISVQGCEFKNFKIDGVVRWGGNGDLLNPATFVCRNIRIERNKVWQYYDINPASIGQIAAGIYGFGGSVDVWIWQNLVDGTFGKQAILFQTEGNGVSIVDNKANNCGLQNNPPGAYAIAAYSGDVPTVQISDIGITHNKVNYSERAGIYLAGIKTYRANDNTLDKPDQHSTGLGTVGAGGIFVNNGIDDARDGSGTVNNNSILDPGFCCINLSLGTFGRAEVEVVGNIGKMQTAGLSRKGLVVNGHGANIGPNTWRGFTDGVLIYNTATDDCGDLTISRQQIDGTGAAGSPTGIRFNSTSIHVGPLEVCGNQIKGCPTGIDLRPVSILTLKENQLVGATGAGIIAQGLEIGIIEGNSGDGGTTGLNVALKAATATARATVGRNLFGAYTTPCVITENTGQVIIAEQGNDFGTQPGISADVGDASLNSGLNQPQVEVFRWSTTLTVNRSATQNATKCFRGDKRTILRDAAVPGAFTLAVIDGASSTTLATIPVNTRGFVDIEFDGANWKLARSGVLV